MLAVSSTSKESREILRAFSGKRQLSNRSWDEAGSEKSRMVLNNFSLERLVAYGVHHADAMELRGRVWLGEDWEAVSTELADGCITPPECAIAPESTQSRSNRLFRASALLRMSQMTMRNGRQKTDVYSRAAGLYQQAVDIVRDRERLVFETPNGLLSGWLYSSLAKPAIGQVIVVGGLDAWAMDHSDMGQALSSRGIDTFVLDGPGQGESRMVHRHYLDAGWEISYGAVLDEIERRGPSLPIGFVGNSMGGAIALHLAARDRRIVACCDNCGPNLKRLEQDAALSFQMEAQCGDVSLDVAVGIWKSIQPVNAQFPVRCPLLVVHGAQDRLVPIEVARSMFEAGTADDRHLFVYEDGDHCVYNHSDDKHALISDWMASRLSASNIRG